MKSLASCINQLLDSLDVDSKKVAQIVLNNNAYKMSIEGIWTDADASKLILEHTNAFYVRADEKVLRKGPDKDKPYIVCEIVLDDALVRSELGANRELLRFALKSNGLTFDEMRIIPAKGGMKKRHPFIESA